MRLVFGRRDDAIERWFGRDFNLDNLRRVLGFISAAVFATAVRWAAAGAVAMRLLGPSTAEFLGIWQVWFPSGALGISNGSTPALHSGSLPLRAIPRRGTSSLREQSRSWSWL